MATVRLPKFDPPRPARVIERPRISELLEETSARSVVWLAAHGGSGKTTAVATWLARRKQPAVWMRLDNGDTHAATFFEYFEAALKAGLPRRKFTLPVYSKEAETDLPNFARRYFRAMFPAFPDPAPAIVLDNMHEVADASPVHALIATLCEECPAGVRIILCGRGRPPAAYQKLAAYGSIEVIGERTLDFTRDELAGALIARGIALDARLGEVHEASEGWIAGALLLSVRAEEAKRPSALPSGDRKALFDFFASEAFDRLAGGDRNLLVRTAFLRDVTPAAARALSGDEHADAHLDRLALGDLFIEKRGGAAPHYRYHDLLRAFLRETAANTMPAEELRELKLATAAQLAGTDEAQDSISLLVECRAWDDAGRAILRHVEPLLSRGRYLEVISWLNALPEDELDTTPWLRFWLGQCLMYTDPIAAQRQFEDAYAAFDATGDGVGRLVCAVSLPATFSHHSASLEYSHWTSRIEDDIGRLGDIESPYLELKCVSEILPLALIKASFLARARGFLTRALALAERVSDPNLALLALTRAAGLAWRQRIEDCFEPAARLNERLGLEAKASPLVVLGWLYAAITYETLYGSAENAARLVARTEAVARETGFAPPLYDAALLRLEVACDRADEAEVERLLVELERHSDPARPFTLAGVHAMRGRLALLRADGETALREGATADAILDGIAGVLSTRSFSLMIESSARMLLDDPAGALAACARYRPHLVGDAMVVCDVFAACIGALDAVRRSRGDSAEKLARALAFARESRYLLFFRHANSLAQELCAAAIEKGIEVDFVRSVIRRRRLAPPAASIAAWPWPLKVRCLGRFEIEHDGAPLANLGKQQKTLQLLQMLVALGGRDVAVDRVIESLWPGQGRVGQQQAFDTTLHRLRKLLGSETALTVAERRLGLNDREVWVDAMSLARRLDEIEAAGPIAPGTREIAKVAEIVALYRGHFLAMAGDEPWILAARERLWDRVRRLLLALAAAAGSAGESEQALRIYHFIADLDPLAEDAFLALMRHFAKLGHKAEALRAYDRCAAALAADLGSSPAASLQALASELRRQP